MVENLHSMLVIIVCIVCIVLWPSDDIAMDLDSVMQTLDSVNL